MIKKHTFKACCGSKVLVFETLKPIKKNMSASFKEAGYILFPNFEKAGIFYVQSANLIATCAYNTNKINVRCSGKDCEQKIVEFERLLEKIVI
jgi:hypothetical protein